MNFSKTTDVILLQFRMLLNILIRVIYVRPATLNFFCFSLKKRVASSIEDFFVFRSFSIFFVLLLYPTLFQPNSSLVNTSNFYHHNYDNIIIFLKYIYKFALCDSWLIKLIHLEIMAI